MEEEGHGHILCFSMFVLIDIEDIMDILGTVSKIALRQCVLLELEQEVLFEGVPLIRILSEYQSLRRRLLHGLEHMECIVIVLMEQYGQCRLFDLEPQFVAFVDF